MKLSKFLPIAGAVAACAAVFAGGAAAATPAAGYEEFTTCPTRTVNTTIRFCISSVVTSGHLQIGSKDTPITDPITLIGATTTTGGFVLGSFDGGRQTVPGGLIGITGLDTLLGGLTGDLLKVYARTELAGTPSNPALDPVNLPIKIKLENPLIGDNCYIGSDTNPVNLQLTRGTTSPPPPNSPITGHDATNVFSDPLLPFITRENDIRLVDNAFAAPAASGCRLNLGLLHISIDALVNLQSGLPSAAGTNETIQNGDAAVVRIQSVYPPSGLG